MCGIAGWVSFDRDLTKEREVVRRMTRTMAKRGPDDEGIWLSPHAALGHRRLSVIDLEGGKQPMIAKEGDTTIAVLIYMGEVYNFRALHDELAALGHRFETRSDTEVVLRAYLQWGAAFPERLQGMFAFALWDARKEELLLVRDRLGIKPLYYQQTAAGVLFGAEPKAILENPAASPVVDTDGLRDLIAFIKTPGRAVFRDMREVRPGYVITVRREGVFERRYWALAAYPHPDDVPTTVRNVRSLLESIVTDQLVSDVPLCTLLSGGLDSSLVTALAQKGLMAEGRGAVRSFSVDFVGQTERFQPDEMRDTPDAPFVADVVRHVGSEHVDIVLSAAELADPAVRAAVLTARDLPLSFGDMDASLYLLFRAIRQRSTVALSGESADEVFGGYRWFHDENAVASDTFPWLSMRWRGVDPSSQSWPTLIDRGLLNKLDIPGYVAARYREAIAEVPRLAGETGHERRMREVCYLHLTRFLPVLLDRKDRMSMASGLEVRVPFCDHRLVQYVFNTPWAMKTFDGREKSLLRAASTDLLPSSVLERKKSPYPATQDPAYAEALRGQLDRLIQKRDAKVLPLLDMDRARALVKGNGEHDEAARAPMEQALLLDAWLDRYDVRLVA